MVPVAAKTPDTSPQLQKGYCAVPIFAGDQAASLRLCIVVRTGAGPVGGFFVHLRDLPDATVYLGCVTDAGGYVHEWAELWLQNPNSVSASLHHHWEGFSNRILDERWNKRAEITALLDRSSVIQLPAAPEQRVPIFFNISVTLPVNPTEKSTSSPWELCTDDQLLEKNGLPPYSHSLARYLYVRDGTSPFLPVTVGAPESEATAKMQDTLGSLVPFNPWCGLLMARKFAPLGFEAYLDVLSGSPWKGIEHGEKILKLEGVYRTLQNGETIQRGEAHLFLGKRGEAARLVETFYLKLDLLAQAFRLVQAFVEAEQLPFLNLTAENFRVTLADTGPTLPFLWSAKVVVAVPGSATALPIQSSQARYFYSGDMNAASVYRPQVSSRILQTTGSVKIGEVSAEDGAITVEGSISTQETIGATENDLVSIRLLLSPGRVDLHGHLLPASGGTERSFRTLPQELPEALSMAIRSAEGVSFTDVSLETLPSVSSPCDLYSLGVLGVRTLLVNDANSLSTALAEFLSLAEACAVQDPGVGDIRQRVRAAVAKDPRWAASLGPQRLFASGGISAGEASASLPLDLWWDAVAALIPCFSGNNRDSYRAHLGDAPPQELEAVFQPAIDEFDKLLANTRSFLFIDTKYNTEINALVQNALRRLVDEASSPKG